MDVVGNAKSPLGSFHNLFHSTPEQADSHEDQYRAPTEFEKESVQETDSDVDNSSSKDHVEDSDIEAQLNESKKNIESSDISKSGSTLDKSSDSVMIRNFPLKKKISQDVGCEFELEDSLYQRFSFEASSQLLQNTNSYVLAVEEVNELAEISNLSDERKSDNFHPTLSCKEYQSDKTVGETTCEYCELFEEELNQPYAKKDIVCPNSNNMKVNEVVSTDNDASVGSSNQNKIEFSCEPNNRYYTSDETVRNDLPKPIQDLEIINEQEDLSYKGNCFKPNLLSQEDASKFDEIDELNQSTDGFERNLFSYDGLLDDLDDKTIEAMLDGKVHEEFLKERKTGCPDTTSSPKEDYQDTYEEPETDIENSEDQNNSWIFKPCTEKQKISLSQTTELQKGMIVRYLPMKGYGFIYSEDASKDIFFHFRDVINVSSDDVTLTKGQMVLFEVKKLPAEKRKLPSSKVVVVGDMNFKISESADLHLDSQILSWISGKVVKPCTFVELKGLPPLENLTCGRIAFIDVENFFGFIEIYGSSLDRIYFNFCRVWNVSLSDISLDIGLRVKFELNSKSMHYRHSSAKYVVIGFEDLASRKSDTQLQVEIGKETQYLSKEAEEPISQSEDSHSWNVGEVCYVKYSKVSDETNFESRKRCLDRIIKSCSKTTRNNYLSSKDLLHTGRILRINLEVDSGIIETQTPQSTSRKVFFYISNVFNVSSDDITLTNGLQVKFELPNNPLRKGKNNYLPRTKKVFIGVMEIYKTKSGTNSRIVKPCSSQDLEWLLPTEKFISGEIAHINVDKKCGAIDFSGSSTEGVYFNFHRVWNISSTNISLDKGLSVKFELNSKSRYYPNPTAKIVIVGFENCFDTDIPIQSDEPSPLLQPIIHPSNDITDIRQSEDLYSWKVGEVCYVKWSEDFIWYKAVIRGVNVDAETVNVDFYHYDDTDTVGKHDVVRDINDIPDGELVDELINVELKSGDNHVDDNREKIDLSEEDRRKVVVNCVICGKTARFASTLVCCAQVSLVFL